jgi:tetratricopeptide (TPR) repeat protein
MAIEGKLEEVGLADICQLLAMGRKTGRLSVTDRSNFGYIHFDGGRVVHATVLNQRDRLGEFLVGNGLVSREELARARDAARARPDVHFGTILVEEKALGAEELERYQRIQVEEAVFHLLAWEEGSFHFAPGETPEGSVPTQVSIPAENLLLEGARRVDEWTQIQQVVSSSDLIFAPKEPAGAHAHAEPTELKARLMDLLDGRRSVRDLVREAGLVEFDVAKALYELSREGWVEVVESEDVWEAAAHPAEGEGEAGRDADEALELGRAFYRSGMWEEARRELERCLELDPACAEALDRLAIIVFRSGETEEALSLLQAAEDADEPTYARARNQALLLERLERYGEAMKALARAETLDGTDPELELARGVVLVKSLKGEEALDALQRYRDRVDGEAEPEPLYFAYGILAAAMAGQPRAALRIGREGLDMHPWSGPILVNLGVVLERAGEPAAAEALYLRATGEARTPPQAHRNLGDLALRRGDRAGARAHYERAVRLDPSLGDEIFLQLGKLFYEEGDHESARRLWARALEINPDNDVARTNLAMVKDGSGP